MRTILFCCLLLVATLAYAQTTCPWQQSSLTNFNTLVGSANADVIVNGKVLIDSTPTNQPNSITVNGELIFANANIQLSFKWMRVNTGGKLIIGSSACPITAKIILTLIGTKTGVSTLGVDPSGGDDLGEKGIAIVHGATLQLFGSVATPSWTRLASTAMAGSRTITLNTATTSWKVGDRIVIASTDFSPLYLWNTKSFTFPPHATHQMTSSLEGHMKGSRNFPDQNEEGIISAISGTTITLEAPLNYTHWGQGNERAEVGLLSRSIVIRGDSPSLLTGFGGHLMLRNVAAAQIQGVEFVQMGQQGVLGRYPVHFHMMGNKIGQDVFIRDSSIHDCFQRCVTIHNTHGVTVQNVVAFNNFGHCFFLEDGPERLNVFNGNLGIRSIPTSKEEGNQIVPSDNQPSVFWITNPNNTYTNNAAVGGVFGFWFAMPVAPTGKSANMYTSTDAEVRPRWTPLNLFRDNVAHSNFISGFMIDEMTRADETLELAAYTPLQPPYGPKSQPWELKQVVATFSNLIAYKNRQYGIWARGGPLKFTNAWLADNKFAYNAPPGLTLLENSYILAESDNLGIPEIRGRSSPHQWSLDGTIKGVETYDNGGPQYCTSTTFEGFTSLPSRPAGAIGFLIAPFVLNTRNKYKAITLINSNPYIADTTTQANDNNRAVAVMDMDGSTSGGKPNTWVLGNNNPLMIHSYEKCTERSAWNNMYTCPPFAEGLVQFRMEVSGTNIDTTGDDGNKYPEFANPYNRTFHKATFHSFDQTRKFEMFAGIDTSRGNKYTFMTNLIPRRGYTIRLFKNIAIPASISLSMSSSVNRDWLIFALPLPLAAAFPVTLTYTNWAGANVAMTPVSDISLLTRQTYYYDSASEHLFLKFHNEAGVGANSYSEVFGYNDYNIDGGAISITTSCTGSKCIARKTDIPSSEWLARHAQEDYYSAVFDASVNRVAFFIFEPSQRLLTMSIYHDHDDKLTGIYLEQRKVATSGGATISKRYIALPVMSFLSPSRTSVSLSYAEQASLIAGELYLILQQHSSAARNEEAKITCDSCSASGKKCSVPPPVSTLDNACSMNNWGIFNETLDGWPSWDLWKWNGTAQSFNLNDYVTHAHLLYNDAAALCGKNLLFVSLRGGGIAIAHHTSNLRPNPIVDTRVYNYFEMYIKMANSRSVQGSIWVQLKSATGAVIGSVMIKSQHMVNSWKIDETGYTRVRIPMSEFTGSTALLGITNIQQVILYQDWTATMAGRQEFYIDNVQLVTAPVDTMTAAIPVSNVQCTVTPGGGNKNDANGKKKSEMVMMLVMMIGALFMY